MKANPEKIYWEWLSENPNAIELLKANPEKIYWNNLASNPNCMDILCENNICELLNSVNFVHRVFWKALSRNPSAIHFLAKLDHVKMKENCKDFYQELIKYLFNPERCKRICDIYNISLIDYIEILKIEN